MLLDTLIVHFPIQHKLLGLLVVHIEETLLLVQTAHLCHLFVGQREVEHADILLYIVVARGSGNDRETFLYMPTDDDLSRSLAVRLGNGLNSRVFEQCTV